MPDGHPPDHRTLRDADALLAAGLIAPAERAAVAAVEARYAVAVPPALHGLIEHPDDPIGRQFIPHPDELVTAPHERADPIGDDALSPVKGIVHRYPDRALLKPLLICPVYCRFCFRREHVGPDGGLLTDAELDAAYAWLADHPAITEVILTGGDPLMLSPRRLGAIVARTLRHPAHRDPAHPHPRPRRRPRARHPGAGRRAGNRAGDVGGAARQPRARIDRSRPRGAAPRAGGGDPGARPIGAAARRERQRARRWRRCSAPCSPPA